MRASAIVLPRAAESCSVELAPVEALQVAQTVRALMHREGAKVPAGVRELCERVAKQMVSAARLSLAQGGGR